MQDPSNQNQNQSKQTNPTTKFKSTHHYNHRRAHSEVNFRLPEDLDLVVSEPPFDGPYGSFEEMGSEDDLFSTFMDIEKLGVGGSNFNDAVLDNAAVVGGGGGEGGERNAVTRPRHRYSNSVDSSSMLGDSSIEAKKAMAPDKLAELWSLDPKRAKRILANRQSASRSKERKARYMSELERKVQTLQTEATTLSAQLSLFQRDTSGLSTENTELKLRFQAMEQQAQLRDALNEALKQEVDRLRLATGEIAAPPSDTYNLGMHHVPYNQPVFFSHQSQPGSSYPQNMQMQQFHALHSSMSSYQQQSLHGSTHAQGFGDTLQQDPLGHFQGLDISSSGSHLVKSEGPSISATESSSTF